MKIGFDLRGNLKPYEKIELSLEEFEVHFVSGLENSSHRKAIFEMHLNYVEDLKGLIGNTFWQWIDGSYISNKSKPNDLDVVTFIPHLIYHELENEIDQRFSKRTAKYFYKYVDAYTVCHFPESHKLFKATQSDEAYWNNLFSKTYMNRARKRHPKGFIEIKFNKDKDGSSTDG